MLRTFMFILQFLAVWAIAFAAMQFVSWARRAARPDPAAALAATAPSNPTDPNVPDLTAMLEPIRARYKIPCLAAMMIRGDQIVAQGIVGVRKAGGTEKATLADQFHLGSDTKAMTATLIATLVDEGKLKWTTTVGEIFGNSVPKMDEAWKSVTIEQLLHHRGGAPANLDAGGLWGRLGERKGTPLSQRRQLVEGVVAVPPVNKPGTTYVYSNAGYAMLGAMAEKVTGTPWEELMQKRIFEPLGITSGGFGAPGSPGKVDQPWGHTTAGKPVEPGPNADNPPAIGPGGTAHVALGDWAKFISLHLRGDAANPNRQVKLLKAESFDELHRPGSASTGQPYMGGWLFATRPWASGGRPGDTGLVLNHAGSNTMWFCVVWIAPERNLAFLAATNQGGDDAGAACDQAVAAMMLQYAK